MKTVSLDELLSEVEKQNARSTAELTLQNTSGADDVDDASARCLLRIHPLDLGHPQVTLDQDETVFGRDDAADVTLDDRSVSRRHAIVERVRSLYILSDLQSTNGTYVNGKRVESQPLNSGDRVRMGDQIFKFMEVDGVEAQFHNVVFDNMSRDGMTGAFNKRYFTELLERHAAASARSDSPVSLILIDIDFFKQVNDTHGHLAGDEVLKELVRRLTETLRAEEVLARFGGEEFAVLVPESSSAEVVAERCRLVVEAEPFDTNVGQLPITISVGVATRRGEFTADAIVTASDAKLYEAKRGGRNRVCVDE